ncbi:hypothetical protein HC864_03695 [Candidatus Gracilibacteria bacterium]|nr:hypothetical protein [Candidatus Gracilibacteria bacterium]
MKNTGSFFAKNYPRTAGVFVYQTKLELWSISQASGALFALDDNSRHILEGILNTFIYSSEIIIIAGRGYSIEILGCLYRMFSGRSSRFLIEKLSV